MASTRGESAVSFIDRKPVLTENQVREIVRDEMKRELARRDLEQGDTKA